ncbi:molybdopterin-dependent oxidoreductase [uncultured Roseobacter sp.]|uniref:molybdopterin-dependent oxidoreductase n=1 Tax=uncultured Roseobacter sp. TaxID=114847 RepID=UPI0026315FD4|nr:molybdopterin-dependent oxidoreductase [uncultured Roseobacter sp.]
MAEKRFMAYTASHWGTYRLDGAGGLIPLEDDPNPSRIGRGWVSAARDPGSRVQAPVVRRGWLEGDSGEARGADEFITLDWAEASRLVAREITRVRDTHGNGAIFGGSYGWASTGRFHHAQSQMRRFLNLAGGYVSSRETYSHAAAEVLFPHIIGLSNRAFQDEMTSLRLVGDHCDLLLAFGGISERTAQISSSGVARHDIGLPLARLRERGARVINISPRGSDMPGAEWQSIRPGTDTALLLALTYEVVAAGQADEAFLQRCTSGWPIWRAYLLGEADGVAKSADWAAPLCDIPAARIREIAAALAESRSMIAVNWGLQRADHGEQVLWAALGLVCVLGQIGQPGTGFAFGYGSTTHVGRAARLIDWPSLPQGRNPVDEFIPVARVADMLLTPGGAYRYNGATRRYPDIRLIYWCGGNPFHHHQDLNRLETAWRRPETIVIQDHSWTATARRADIVLPATSPLERRDLMMNRRDPSLFFMSPAFAPMGAAWDDYDIFRGIAREMGLEAAFTEGRDSDGWLRHLWGAAQCVAQQEGIALPGFDGFAEAGRFDVPDAEEDRIAFAGFVADPEGAPLATESGRITLHNATIDGFALSGCPGHPTWIPPVESLLAAQSDELHLISGQPDTRLHGQNDRGSEALADKIAGREPAYLHPETAAARGVQEGDILRLWTARGACLAGLRLDPLLRRDCIALATGAWFDPQIIDGAPLEVHGNPNVLTIDRGCSELSQGNMAHTALVRVEKWTRPLPPLTIDRPPTIRPAEGAPAEGRI